MPPPHAWQSGRRSGLSGAVLALMAGGLLSGFVSGQDEGRTERLPKVNPAEAGYAVRHWTVADGLPGQRITALAQTPDGYLWCGTDDGLVRYDGARFRVFFADEVPELEGFGIGRLSCDREGRLWIWGANSELVVLEEGRFRKIGPEDGWNGKWIRPIVRGRSSDYWFVGGPGEQFHRFRDGRFEVVPQPALAGEEKEAKNRVARLTEVWMDDTEPRWALMGEPRGGGGEGAGSFDRRLVTITKGGIEPAQIERAGANFRPEVLFTLPDGAAALGARDAIYAVEDGRWVPRHRFDRSIAEDHGSPLEFRQDAQGNFWVATDAGGLVLSTADGTTRQFELPEEERRSTIRSLCLDREGSLWVGSRDGLYQVVRKAVRSVGRAEGIPEDEVRAVAAGGDGRVWLASEEAVVPVSSDGSIGEARFIPRDDLVRRTIIERIAPSADGTLWVALRSFRIERQNWVHELWRTRARGFVYVTDLVRPVTSLHELRDGTLLIGTDGGLFAWADGGWRSIELPGLSREGGERPHVTALVEDTEGRVVAGVLTTGLFRSENGPWKRLDLASADERQRSNVRSLAVDQDGTLWIGCGRNGLACLVDGKWESFAGMTDRLPREITALAADESGGLWLASTTGEGLVRFGVEELQEWRRDRETAPTATEVGRVDGLPSIVAHANYSPLCRDAKGRLWIATKQGAAMLRPADWKRRRETVQLPEVHLQEIRLNDELVSEYASGNFGTNRLREVEVPPGPRRLEFRYIGIDLAAPEAVRYRYRLEGYEQEWTEAGDRAVAVYPNVPPGRYVFRVAAAGRYGRWNEKGAGAAVSVEPRWWERTLTRVLAVVLVVGLLALAYVYRLNQAKAKTRMQEEFSRALIWSQEAERKRLARELHDGLGHELLVLKGGIDRELAKRDEAGQELSEKAGEVIHQVREISHDLRPPELERFGIGPALESLAHATAELTGIELAIDLDPLEERLRPVIEISLFRIAQEAFSNMAKHSDASEGRVALKTRGDQLVLTIEDDGRGFESAGVERAPGSTGLGLSGMEERTHLIGGTWDCKTEPGGGVRVTVTLPLLYRT